MNKTKKMPDTLVIASMILLVFIILTWIVPAGEFSRSVVNGRNVLVPNSYKEVAPSPQSVFTFFTAPLRGFMEAAEVIAFIFIVGGAFGMLNATGAISAGLHKMVQFSMKKPLYKWLIIPVLMLVFSFAGASFGMSEEVLVFILITIPLAHALGLDTITGVAIPFIGAGAGFAGAFYNPFTVGIAQSIAELPTFSGLQYRLFVWVVFTLIAIGFVMLYAYKVSQDASKSVLYEEDELLKASEKSEQVHEPLTFRRKLILCLLGLSLALLAWGVTEHGWYMVEIGALFFGLGIAAGLVGGMNPSVMSKSFAEGAKEMMTACLVVAFCKGILLVATDGKIIDTLLYYVSESVKDYPRAVSVELMFIVQSVLNFFIPSGSGQAALTMPIMAPLSDLLGVSRQTAVLAFQFGDGLSNLVIPTSGVTMGILSIAKIPYNKWIQWMLPLMGLFVLAAMLLLLGPVMFFQWN
ncbi:Na+/H+ antiporter NhaC family protein [Limibacter armeniacum]|uniref:YfcC family protein n=1 Tax=Limibacter armeniacum TaxID=466084 RepID=UPI002FE55CFC